MKQSFLCHGHRNWLLQHPELARSIWFNNYEQACQLVEEKNFARAIAFAGCAMEAADIAMDAETIPCPDLIEHYTRTCALLVRLMERARRAPHDDSRRQASRVLH